jgi:hypothetical protein
VRAHYLGAMTHASRKQSDAAWVEIEQPDTAHPGPSPQQRLHVLGGRNETVLSRHRFAGRSGEQTGSWRPLYASVLLNNEMAESVGDETFCGSLKVRSLQRRSLRVCQGKFPICKLQKSGQVAIFFSQDS